MCDCAWQRTHGTLSAPAAADPMRPAAVGVIRPLVVGPVRPAEPVGTHPHGHSSSGQVSLSSLSLSGLQMIFSHGRYHSAGGQCVTGAPDAAAAVAMGKRVSLALPA